jgi:TRAP-type C4-dicarboxylate transport system permease small subunit
LRPDHPTIQWPINALTFLGGVLMLLMMAHIVVDVGARVLFNSPFDGTTEIVAGYYMVAVIFFPLAYVTHHEGHITVELFTRGLPPRRLAGLEVAIGVVAFCFLAWFTWESVVAAYDSLLENEQWETADDLVTIWPSRWFIPIGLATMAIYLVYRLADDLRAARGRPR